MRKIESIPCAYKDIKKIAQLGTLLKNIGYKLLHGLDNPYIISKPVAVVIDTKDKKFFQTNVTCMSCWSSWKRRPLFISEVIQNFDELVIKRNNLLYTKMLNSVKNDLDRPIGGLYKNCKISK